MTIRSVLAAEAEVFTQLIKENNEVSSTKSLMSDFVVNQ